jgi:endonuclease/exonuclease/phosphatase family metal-dependent hydrolase
MTLRLCVFAVISLLFSGFSYSQVPLRVMTFNIRYANPDDGPYTWQNRRQMVYNVVTRRHPSVVGFQEVLKSQLDDLRRNLPGYAAFGVGRDDGKESGEYAVIFYDTVRFTFLTGSNFWLSETPEEAGTKSWGAGCNRIVTWIHVTDRKSGHSLFFFNTHFDNASSRAREKSAMLLCERISIICGEETAIVTGDFNDSVNSAPYTLLTKENCLTDTRTMVRNPAPEPDFTYIGFPYHPERGNTCDYIFLRKPGSIRVKAHTVINDHTGDKYPSDHFPVMSDLEILKSLKK